MSAADFGLTNDRAQLDAAIAWRDAAAADGWTIEPTYRTEDVSRAARGTKDGFVFTVLTRTEVGSWKYQANVHLWGPDGMALVPPDRYDWQAIQSAVRKCNYCGAEDVAVERVGFAGRCCAACMPTVRPKVEYPGWTR